MIILYLDYLPVILFGLAGWVISRWVGRVMPGLANLARAGALLAFLSGFYKATTVLLMHGYGLTFEATGLSQLFFLLLGLAYYYLALSIYGVKRFLLIGENFNPSRYLTLAYPLLFLLALVLIGIGSPEENYWGLVLLSAMTVSNIAFVFFACKLALVLKDSKASWLIIVAILLNFIMAGLLIALPLENDVVSGYYPNLIREIILNTFAQCALLWAVLRIRERLSRYQAPGSCRG